jgi:hypothetical protein
MNTKAMIKVKNNAARGARLRFLKRILDPLFAIHTGTAEQAECPITLSTWRLDLEPPQTSGNPLQAAAGGVQDAAMCIAEPAPGRGRSSAMSGDLTPVALALSSGMTGAGFEKV